MGRRDDQELPPVEVLGVEPQITSVQEVSTRRPDGPRRHRRIGIIVGAVVFGLLLAGVVLGDDEETPTAVEEETTATHRTTATRGRPTTTSTVATTTTLSGPLFAGHAVPGWILSGNQSGWTLIDVRTGARLDPGLPFDDPYSARAVTNGVVLRSGGDALYYDLRIPKEARQPVNLGRADQIFRTADQDWVWLVEGMQDPLAETYRARVVDLEGRVLRSFAMPAGAYGAASAQGLLLDRGGRVYLVTESGVRAIGVGDLIGAVGSSVLAFTCDDDASSCGIELRTVSGRLLRRLDADVSLPELGWNVSSAPDGRWALVTYDALDAQRTQLRILDPDGDTIATVHTHGYLSEGVSWLPGDAGLVGARDGRIVWIHQASDGWTVDELPSLAAVESMGLLTVIEG